MSPRLPIGVATTNSLPVNVSMSLIALASFSVRTFLRRLVSVALLLCFIQSCGTTTVQPDIAIEEDPYADALRWEQLARQARGAEKAVYQLSAAEAWYLSGDVSRALYTITSIDTFNLPDDQLIDHALLLAEIYQFEGRYVDALDALQEPVRQNRLNAANPEKRGSWAERAGDIHMVLGEYAQASLYFDLGLSSFDSVTSLERLRRSLWRSLTLAEELPAPPYSSEEMTGWIDLAETSNRSAGTLSDQLMQFETWRTNNFRHPANIEPPSSILALQNLNNESAPRVALMLPLTGSLAEAGNAVLEGYLATAVTNRGTDPLNPSEILIYDTHAENIETISQDIADQQVSLVIGPLQKDNVAEFVELVDPTLRVLALNSLQTQTYSAEPKSSMNAEVGLESETTTLETAEDFQGADLTPNENVQAAENILTGESPESAELDKYPDSSAAPIRDLNANALGRKTVLRIALNVEDEARQAATAALRDNHHIALAFVPDTEPGERAGKAFADAWESQNGVVVAVDKYSTEETHNLILESRLHINQSNARMGDLRRLLATNLEFTARRRQDIDTMFLSASPDQARQIKPMLAFFFAEDLPIYSTSTIYDGVDDPKANRDLDDIQFNTMPWFISDSAEIELAGAAPRNGGLLKLQAMGVDAYYLSQRIPLFLNAEGMVYHGVLGKLSLRPGQQELDRQQVWAQFKSGQVEAIQ